MTKKVLVQIPCHNEEKNISLLLKQLSSLKISNCSLHVLVIDDGSTDETGTITQDFATLDASVNVLHLGTRRGLAFAFRSGADYFCGSDFDFLVNIDGDAQYEVKEIPDLLEPILSNRADVVLGNRNVRSVLFWPKSKRFMQIFGSAIISFLSGVRVGDATTGFRAYNRRAVELVLVSNNFSHTLEPLLQLKAQRLRMSEVQITANPVNRPSRLAKSTPHFILKSILVISSSFVAHRPLKFIGLVALPISAIGLILVFRFLIYFIAGDGSGKIQSLVLGSALLLIGTQLSLVAFLVKVIQASRDSIRQYIQNLYSPYKNGVS